MEANDNNHTETGSLSDLERIIDDNHTETGSLLDLERIIDDNHTETGSLSDLDNLRIVDENFTIIGNQSNLDISLNYTLQEQMFDVAMAQPTPPATLQAKPRKRARNAAYRQQATAVDYDMSENSSDVAMAHATPLATLQANPYKRARNAAYRQQDVDQYFLMCRVTLKLQPSEPNHKVKQGEIFLCLRNKWTPGPEKWECRCLDCTHKTGRFSETDKIMAHVQRVHLKSTRVTCPSCNKSFSDKYNLKKHMMVGASAERQNLGCKGR